MFLSGLLTDILVLKVTFTDFRDEVNSTTTTTKMLMYPGTSNKGKPLLPFSPEEGSEGTIQLEPLEKV